MADFDDEATAAEEDRLIEANRHTKGFMALADLKIPRIKWLLEHHYEYGKARRDPLDLMRIRQLKRELLKRYIQGDKR